MRDHQLDPEMLVSKVSPLPFPPPQLSPKNHFTREGRMGALGISASNLPTLPPPVGRQRSWEDLSAFTNLYLTETGLLIEKPERSGKLRAENAILS